MCEERIIVLRATSPRAALAKAKRLGREAQFKARFNDRPARLKFIGVLQLLELGIGTEHNEVWWELRRRLLPLERRSRILPPPKALWAFADQS
jgi:hypothetical protein